MVYLLDTNIISDYVKGDDKVIKTFNALSPQDIAISTISQMEIEYGLKLAPNSIQKKIGNKIEVLFKTISICSFDSDDARAAADVRQFLKKKGMPIGPYDILLAGCALSKQLTFVTANTKEFERIPSLMLENWRD